MSDWTRRSFLAAAPAAGLAFGLAPSVVRAAGLHARLADLMSGLLREWCGGLMRLQIPDADGPERAGAFRCPACPTLVHGRCGDASFPLLHVAAHDHRPDHLHAALRVRAWMRNVDAPGGAWLNDPGEAHTWKGITVFGAIALAESLKHHGDLLDRAVREAWTARLRDAIGFVDREFHWNNYSNINYPVTASYALALCGGVLDDARLAQRGREFARRSLDFLTRPTRLLYGEGKPYERTTPRGCVPVDLGYNVEESLPALVLYGLLTKDEEVLGPVTESLRAHLEFMLPDGGWDNSWGTRSYKWTWWGSRTSDGCQPAYALLAAREPAFAVAALRNAELLRACTRDGLLHGGPHAIAHGAAPCVHHTFCHAKALATVLAHPAFDRGFDTEARLPRDLAHGVRAVPEIGVWLAAGGPWRATIAAGDWFNTKAAMVTRQASGGSPGVLWHSRVGIVLCASLADYVPWEPSNMPALEGPDTPLTPRIEIAGADGARWSNLYDPAAQVETAGGSGVALRASVRLLDAAGREPVGGPCPCTLEYRFEDGAATIAAEFKGPPAARAQARLVLPVVATSTEKATRPSPERIAMERAGAKVTLVGPAGMEIDGGPDRRIYNHVPGLEALPVRVPFDAEGRCVVRVEVG